MLKEELDIVDELKPYLYDSGGNGAVGYHYIFIFSPWNGIVIDNTFEEKGRWTLTFAEMDEHLNYKMSDTYYTNIPYSEINKSLLTCKEMFFKDFLNKIKKKKKETNDLLNHYQTMIKCFEDYRKRFC